MGSAGSVLTGDGLLAGGCDRADRGERGLRLGQFGPVGELGRCEAVELAEADDADAAVEEVFEQGVVVEVARQVGWVWLAHRAHCQRGTGAAQWESEQGARDCARLMVMWCRKLLAVGLVGWWRYSLARGKYPPHPLFQSEGSGVGGGAK